jgi:hypothetical protein
VEFETDALVTAHNFLDAQPVKNADVFLVRAVLHNWSDKYCLQILRHLREAATPSTQLIVVDNLMPYACVDDSLKDVPGADLALPPAPLLPNGGHASAVSYYEDLGMLLLMNGKERTIRDVHSLLESAGWRLVRIVHCSAYTTSKAIAVPA